MLIERRYFLLVHDVCTLHVPPDIYNLFIVTPIVGVYNCSGFSYTLLLGPF